MFVQPGCLEVAARFTWPRSGFGAHLGARIEQGIVAPRGLPPAIVAKLSEAVRVALDEPEIKERLNKLGLIPSWQSPQAYGESLRQDIEKYKRVVDASHILLTVDQ